MLKKLLLPLAILLFGCAHTAHPPAKPTAAIIDKANAPPPGWQTISDPKFNAYLPPDYTELKAGEESPGAIVYEAIDSMVVITFLAEKTEYDLDTYASGFANTLPDINAFLIKAVEGEIDNTRAALIEFAIPGNLLGLHFITVKNGYSFNIDCAVSLKAEVSRINICFDAAKALKIK
jgi:hypothetical protein